MSIELKTGGINEFFNSAKETANEIDSGKKVSKKNIVWINTTDLVQILKPERTKIVTFLRGKKEVVFSDLEVEMGRTKASLNNDLKILQKYQLVNVFKRPNPGHGIHKVVSSMIGTEKIIFNAEL
jgi:predicted transcriptional regulator